MMDSFPAEYARTLNYTLGSPRTFQISKNGRRVFFLRAPTSSERRLDLWLVNVGGGKLDSAEIRVVEVADLQVTSATTEHDPEAERLRKERLREASSGITAYAID